MIPETVSPSNQLLWLSGGTDGCAWRRMFLAGESHVDNAITVILTCVGVETITIST